MHPLHELEAAVTSGRGGGGQARAVNVAGSDEAEAVRLLENATAETAVRIKRDAKENAWEIMQDARVQADRILDDTLTDAQGVVAKAAQDREQARRDRELAADARVQADRILDAARTEARRIVNETQIRGEAGNVPPPPDGGLSQPTGAGAVVGTTYAAVKKLDPSSMQGQTEFLKEVQVLGGCRHENLLPLIGFSADQGMHHEHAGVCVSRHAAHEGRQPRRQTLSGPVCASSSR
jgi:hypothetical protein